MVVNIPEKYYDLIKDTCLKFVWNDKPHLISYKVIINKCQKGELNFPEIFQKMFAFRMKLLSRLLDESYVAFWKSTCLYFFSKVEEMKLGIEIFFCKMNLTCLPEFYQIMLKAWYTGRNTLPRHCQISQLITVTFFHLFRSTLPQHFFLLKYGFLQLIILLALHL